MLFTHIRTKSLADVKQCSSIPVLRGKTCAFDSAMVLVSSLEKATHGLIFRGELWKLWVLSASENQVISPSVFPYVYG